MIIIVIIINDNFIKKLSELGLVTTFNNGPTNFTSLINDKQYKRSCKNLRFNLKYTFTVPINYNNTLRLSNGSKKTYLKENFEKITKS